MLSLRTFVLAAAALASLGLAPAHAQQVVYSNGNLGNGFSWNISEYVAADDFLVTTPITVNAIRFNALDFSPGLLSNFNGTLSWFIYTDNGATVPKSLPDTVLASGSTSSVTVTDSGVSFWTSPDAQIAQLDFEIPTMNLGPGRYWLALKERTPSSAYDGSRIYWAGTYQAYTPATLIGNGYRANDNETSSTDWTSFTTITDNDLSFQLLNTAAATSAPEPASLALLTLGTMAGAGLIRRRTLRS